MDRCDVSTDDAREGGRPALGRCPIFGRRQAPYPAYRGAEPGV